MTSTFNIQKAADTEQAPTTDLEVAKLLIGRLGISPSQLQETEPPRQPIPTFAEYIPLVEQATPDSSAQTWRVYWRVLGEHWGERRIDTPDATEIMTLAKFVQRRASTRPGNRGGHAAMAHFIDATRRLYRHAVADEHIPLTRNPASQLIKPRRHRSTRRALSRTQLAEINHVARHTGTDPSLDALILRLHTETACRRGGALALRPIDLDQKDCIIRLREKGGTVRDQPVSPTLMRALTAHNSARNPTDRSDTQLLRHQNGTPVHSSRYEALWTRLGRHLPWISTLEVTAHWIRYTTLTWVERNFSYAVAAAYAGHVGGGSNRTTLTYVPARLEELAVAVSTLTGEQHPLAATTAP